jgi:hypothetical protein
VNTGREHGPNRGVARLCSRVVLYPEQLANCRGLACFRPRFTCLSPRESRAEYLRSSRRGRYDPLRLLPSTRLSPGCRTACGHHRLGRDLERVVERLVGDVRNVHDHSQPNPENTRAPTAQRTARACRPRAAVEYPRVGPCHAHGSLDHRAAGMENANVAPGPSLCSAQRRPRCLSIIARLTDSPIPIPPLFVV